MSTYATRSRKAALVALAALSLCALCALAALSAQRADGLAANELGKTKGTPNPLCPKDCEAVGSVTGFQVTAKGEKSPFTVPSAGRIVAWSVDLSRPEKDQIASFNEELFPSKRYDGSVARLSVLKPKGRAQYKLTKQSPPVELQRSFGTRPVFTLGKTLKVKKGQRIALTLPTWAPLYVNGLDTDQNEWIASRDSDECGNDKILDARPQQKKGSIRSYGCRFNGERLLYTAYFVPAK